MTYTVNDGPATAPRIQSPATDHRSTAELVKLAAEQVSTLVRDELKLAQAELAQKGKRAGAGVGMFGGAGVIAFYGVGALLTAAVIGLATVVPAWLSALIIGVVLLAVAGVLALLGRTQVRQAGPPMPRDTVASVKADLDTVTHSVKERGQR